MGREFRAVGDNTSEPLGLVMMDAMIARAVASCERARAELAGTPRSKRSLVQKRQAQLKTMEDTLARLKAQRGAAEA
jgi:hypothetical protein